MTFKIILLRFVEPNCASIRNYTLIGKTIFVDVKLYTFHARVWCAGSLYTYKLKEKKNMLMKYNQGGAVISSVNNFEIAVNNFNETKLKDFF